MARYMSLEDANKAERLILFDTNVLISAYRCNQSTDPNGPLFRELLGRVEGSRRFTSELVLWEFLHPNISCEEINIRRKWLKINLVKIHGKYPSGYIKTYEVLAKLQDARGDPVDGALAAYSVASKGKFVIATADSDDFCWHKDIVVIADFFKKTC